MSLYANLVPGLLKVTKYILYANTNHMTVLFALYDMMKVNVMHGENCEG